mgnify:CR=1 FL=1
MRLSALAFLTAALLAAALPSAGVAQTPFGGGSGSSLQTEPVDEPEAPGKSADDGLDTWQTALILVGGGFLLGGIAWAIIRDARRRNQAAGDGHEEGRERARAEKEAERHRRKAAARKKSKAAKQARRSNRPR